MEYITGEGLYLFQYIDPEDRQKFEIRSTKFEKRAQLLPSFSNFVLRISNLFSQPVWHFQTVLSHQFRIREQLFGGPVGGEFSAIEYQYTRAGVEY
jgi:hypothetical protein